LFRRKRRGKVLDVVGTAIPGGAAAWNAGNNQRRFNGLYFETLPTFYAPAVKAARY
jgi:hypothetical protein